ncbi:hypothetical protein RUM43_001455 [Polyplax serrata]|uniref:Uncharacterized protein n=1 Tax=Polyplax serrata TaxID=468196 RepID=A0AAN8SET6_POLSC
MCEPKRENQPWISQVKRIRFSFGIPRHLVQTGAITDTKKETPAGEKPSEAESRGLLGRLPRLETFSNAGAPSSPHKVANNIKGFFTNKLENVIPDTGKHFRHSVLVA